jgi:hypothetical protein
MEKLISSINDVCRIKDLNYRTKIGNINGITLITNYLCKIDGRKIYDSVIIYVIFTISLISSAIYITTKIGINN